MDLKEIVSRICDGLVYVDGNTQIQNSANPETSDYGNYLKGVGCLGEHQFRDEIVSWWNSNYADTKMDREIKYPENGRWKCDVTLGVIDERTGLRSDGSVEWAIELKYIRFIGDNGKVNNFGLGKVVSPYKAEHSSVGDAMRLSQTSMGKRKAVIMYGFDYDEKSEPHCRELLAKMGLSSDRADFMKKTIRASTHDGTWKLEPIAPIFEAATESSGITLGKREVSSFSGLKRHPNYRMGKILAWEILD